MTEQQVTEALKPLENTFHQFCKMQMDMGRINHFEFQGAQQVFYQALGQVIHALSPATEPKLKEVAK